jgi:hypothetical protein
VRRIEIVLFVLAWTSYAYFHQGGGWNQNGRFALTRALVDTGGVSIDETFVYAPAASSGSTGLRRIPVRDGVFTDGGMRFALAWMRPDVRPAPLSAGAPPDARRVPVEWAGVTGDVSFAGGRLHPNKAPGTSLAAVPGYALVRAVERVAGIDPDDAWALTVNAWLTGVLSVALVAGLGVVVGFRLARRWSGGSDGAALFAALTLAFGTLYFPYATMLYEHDLVAVALLASLALAFRAPSAARLAAAGACAGAAIVLSYLSVVAAGLLVAYVAWTARRWRSTAAFAIGAILPLGLLAAYNVACFGTPLASNYTWENPMFKEAGGGIASLFTAPRWDVLAALLASPMRGLFAGAPVLLLGVVGIVAMIRRPDLRAEGLLCAGMLAHVLAFNVTFSGWMGGWACGPRYLIPALPFLAIPAALALPRAAWIRGVLLAVSIAGMAIVTAVDPQTPATSTEMWRASPIWTIDLPQLAGGSPGAYARETWPDSVLEMYVEPVSANPVGFYSGTPGRLFPLGSETARRNSFNAGELIAPGRRVSLLPWLALTAFLAGLLAREVAPGRPFIMMFSSREPR